MATAIASVVALVGGLVSEPVLTSPTTVQEVLITATGDAKSLPTAGYWAPYLAVEMEAEGTREIGYLLMGFPWDPSPPIAAVCTLVIERRQLLQGRWVAQMRDQPWPENEEVVPLIQSFDCRITSDSPIIKR